jgi:microcystin-dependent protein
MKNLIFLLAAVVFAASVQAQIGFNNPNPDPSSILDLTANDKGLLTPRMTKSLRDAIVNPAVGLLVYELPASSPVADDNGNVGGFFYYTSGGWIKLNHQWTRVGTTNDVALSGNASVSGSISSGSITNSGALSTATIASSGNVSAGSLSVTGFATNALVPSGSILMWSGSIASIPSGWVLCNGTNGTPDLRDRFIVGAGSSYAVSNTGGQNSVSLSISEMPSHNHTFTDYTWSSQAFGNLGKFGSGAPEDSDNSAGSGIANQTSFVGSGLAHENRPPYYSLAYIMKL